MHLYNKFVVELYRDMGFVDVGHCTLAETFVLNRDGDLISGDSAEKE